MLSSTVDVPARTQAIDEAWGAFFRSRLDTIVDTPGSTVTTGRATRLQVLRLEIDALDKYTRYVHQRWNACIGAASLPPEILASIFAYAQAGWEPDRTIDPDGYFVYDLGWIRTTHVCSSWRQAAIGAAHLWRSIYILVIPHQLGTDILKRSLRLPLNLFIHIDQTDHLPMNATKLVRDWLCGSVLSRVEHLSVSASADDLDQWKAFLRHPFPALRGLNIDLSRGEDVGLVDRGLLGGHHPQLLSRLSFKDCIPDQTSNLFGRTLKFLSITVSSDMEYDHNWFTTSAFRSHLKSMLNLEELRLSDTLPYPDGAGILRPIYTFPSKFRRLQIYCSDAVLFATSYISFWLHFRFPNTAAIVSVVQISDTTHGYRGSQTIGALTQIDPSGPTPKELWISQARIKLSFAQQPRERWTVQWTPSHLTPSQALTDWADRVNEDRHLYTGGSLATEYTSHSTFDSVQAINFTLATADAFNNHHDPSIMWIAKFGSSRLVQRISAPYIACDALFGALAHHDTSTRAFRLFPSLEILVLFADLASTTWFRTSLDMALLDMLELRRELGTPVKELLVEREMASWSVWGNVCEGTAVTFFDSK